MYFNYYYFIVVFCLYSSFKLNIFVLANLHDFYFLVLNYSGKHKSTPNKNVHKYVPNIFAVSIKEPDEVTYFRFWLNVAKTKESKQTKMNVSECLKRIIGGQGIGNAKVYGIYNRCLKKIFQKFQKNKNRTIFLVILFGCFR